MTSKNAEIAKKEPDALFVLFAFSEADSPGPEDGAFRSCPPETPCNYDGGANQFDWDPGDLAMTYLPGLAQVPGTNPATGAYGYFAADHLGSTRGVYNQSKAMTAALEYAPYGEPRAWRGDAPAPTYTGHYRDAESGLYFAPYRYYLPDAGRWLTRDPLGMVDGPNVYGYGRNSPVQFRDQLGLEVFCYLALELIETFHNSSPWEPISAEWAGWTMDHVSGYPKSGNWLVKLRRLKRTVTHILKLVCEDTCTRKKREMPIRIWSTHDYEYDEEISQTHVWRMQDGLGHTQYCARNPLVNPFDGDGWSEDGIICY